MGNDNIIELYSRLIRDVINYAAQRIDAKPFLEKVKVRLGFDKIEGWNILTSSLDLIDDTECAKSDYYHFQLIGPTRYESIGEMYLRFYGILNAIYLQKSAITELAELFKISDKVKHIKSLEALTIIQLRHIAGSHTVNFIDPISRRKRTFMISQDSLRQNRILVMDDDDKFNEYDLPELIKDYDKSAMALIEIIANKSICSICKTDSKGKTTFGDRFERIQKTSQGTHYIDIPNGNTIVIESRKS
jgi:hypothetical protein